MSDTFSIFAAILVRMFAVPLKDIAIASNLERDLGLDSLDRAELALEVEDEFHVIVSDELAPELFTVGDWISYINHNHKAAA